MAHIKEFVRPENYYSTDNKSLVVIRSKYHGGTLSRILEMVDTVKNDFPELSDEEIEVVVYRVYRARKSYGVEAMVAAPVPDSYQEIQSHHLTV